MHNTEEEVCDAISHLSFFGLVFWQRWDLKRQLKWSEVSQLHDDLFEKYLELVEDPTITLAEWREWIRIFELADQDYDQHNYYKISFNRLGDFARKRVDYISGAAR